MKIIYLSNGTILANGNITENATHYILDDAYFDKNGLSISEVTLPTDYTNQSYLYKNGALEKIKLTVISKWEFRQRMTFEEKLAIDNFEVTIDNQDPLIVSPAAKQYRKMVMTTVMKDFDAADMITLTDPSMIEFANAVAGCEIISAQRIAEILQIV